MGSSMSQRLITVGHPLTVTTRTPAKASALLEAGATWADTAADVAAASDITFSMVGYPDDVREVVLGDRGALAGASPGSVLVDMTSSDPALAVEIAQRAAARGSDALDAPVSGGDIGARNGTLSIMVGGTAAAFDRVRPVLANLGTTIVHQGGPGAGQRTKIVNQTLIAGTMIGLSEALLYAHRAGLDVTSVLDSVSSGAAGSWSLTNLAPRVLRGDFEPGFYVDHFVKDLDIALEDTRRMNLTVPGLALAEQLYRSLQAQGHGRQGTQALVFALAALSGTDWPA